MYFKQFYTVIAAGDNSSVVGDIEGVDSAILEHVIKDKRIITNTKTKLVPDLAYFKQFKSLHESERNGIQ